MNSLGRFYFWPQQKRAEHVPDIEAKLDDCAPRTEPGR